PAPSSYTIAIYNNSKGTLLKTVTAKTTSSTVSGLPSKSKININVWANGGPTAPPHASINGYTL
ncbi:MAG: hypothetical protein KGJ07_09945, partial [Patescibacteria group bacterium]|nr:hypothetical protein [Patescibacteria group bacterium]